MGERDNRGAATEERGNRGVAMRVRGSGGAATEGRGNGGVAMGEEVKEGQPWGGESIQFPMLTVAIQAVS